MRAPLPANEAERLELLHSLALLDTPAEQDFDDLTLIATQVCQVPVVAMTLIDTDRQWFKSSVGFSMSEIPRDIAFCSHTLLSPHQLTLVQDARLDARFADNPLVTGPPGVRFYAGAPLSTPEGLVLGTLCLMDVVPRSLSLEQQEILQALARQMMQQIRLRRILMDLDRTSRQRQAIADSVPVLIGLLDAQGRYCFCNSKFRDWLGLEPGDLLGKTPAEALPAELRDIMVGNLDKTNTGEEAQFDLPLPSGKTLAVHYLPHWHGDEQQGVFVLAVDVSARKQIEELKNAFVSSVSHELRTPLTSITGALGLLRHGQPGDLSEPQKNLLDIAHKNSQRLMFLINDLLDMEKLLAGKMHFDLQPLSLSALLEKSLYENTTYAEAFRVRFSLRLPADDQQVVVDEQRFLQVMANLLSNAVKFSPADAVVEVAVVVLDDSHVRISVQDHGPGIEPEFQARLFEKFSQADASAARQRGGTGLGLAISRELVEKMGGNIGVDSVPGAGSCFFVDLPLAGGQED